MLSGTFLRTQLANQTPYDNSTSGFVATDVQAAIDELHQKLLASVSPGFGFGRSGVTPPSTWLLRVGGPPSNKTGIPMGISTPTLKTISVGNENITTFSVQIYEHEGDEINLTLLTTVNIISARTASFSVNISATQGRQLAARISAGSPLNPGVDVQIAGAI